MSSAPSAIWSDAELRRGLQLHCELMSKYAQRQHENLLSLYQIVPAFRPVLQSTTPAQMKQASAANLAKLRTAAFDDDWGPYLETLHQRGRAWAAAGVAFADWSEILQRISLFLNDLVFEEHGEDRETCRILMKATTALYETILHVVGRSYFAALQEALRALSTPVLELGEGLLLVPLIGVLDDARMQQLQSAILEGVRSRAGRAVVIDLTGVADVDSHVAAHIVRIATAARLLGARVRLSGLSAAVAEALVHLGVSFVGVDVSGSLEDACAAARV